MSAILLLVIACGDKEDTSITNEPSTSPTTEPSSEASTEPSSEVSTEPSSEIQDDFCSLYSETCDEWSSDVTCENWWMESSVGTYDSTGSPLDSTGATQSCYEYHLNVATTMTTQSDIDMHCAHAIGGTDVNGTSPCN